MEPFRHLLVVVLALLLLAFSNPAVGVSISRKADSIQIVLDKNQLVLPGESFRIGVTSYYKNGKVKHTTGLMGGSVWWWNYTVDVTGGTNLGGRITVNEQLLPSRGKYIALKVYPRKHPELSKEMLLPLNYETRIVYRPTNKFDRAPGSQIKGELYAEFNNGMSRVYQNLRSNRESGYFKFTTSGGNWENGKFIIDPDFMKVDEHRASLIVNSLRNQLLSDTFNVLLDYRHTYHLDLSGERGLSGFSGANGSSGGSGDNGFDGQDGGHGEYGYDGPELGVWVDLYRDSILNTDLLYVYAQNMWTGEEYRYLVNPDGGKLQVSSRGGDGGRAGDGGNGGNGGQGLQGEQWVEMHIEKKMVKTPVVKKVIQKKTIKVINAEGKEEEVQKEVEVEETVYVDEEIEVEVEVVKIGPGGRGGDGGWGGAGGIGGGGGYGGNINLYFTDDAWQYQHVIVASSVGGSGGLNGNGGRGGIGGEGGMGNPHGPSGSSGQTGTEAIGWAEDGGSGRISVSPTEEFFFYSPRMEASGIEKP